MTKDWHLVMPQELYDRLHSHLFPGDGDEHGAVIQAGVTEGERGVRVLARELHLAADGVDYVPGKRGYRMLRADFIARQVDRCASDRLVYLAIHNHGGTDRVQFSEDDLRSHRRGYPALLDIVRGMPVGALVFAQNAVSGSIWLSGEKRVQLVDASIVGGSFRRLHPSPRFRATSGEPIYDRQAKIFGEVGQDILRRAKIGIIGLGGAGSLLAENLGRLGVGNFVLADSDRAEPTNHPRLTGASRLDTMALPIIDRLPRWAQRVALSFAKPKVLLARRNILRANPHAHVRPLFGDFLHPEVAQEFIDCDYLFLAADTMRARLLFNAIVHQYLIPGVQVGAKIHVDQSIGAVLDAYSVVRPVTPKSGCLLCNSLINSAKLQEESISQGEREAQKYINEPGVIAPSVITMNAVAVAQAANDFLFYITGLRDPNCTNAYLRFHPGQRTIAVDQTRKSSECPECGTGLRSRLAYGDARRLPVTMPS